MPKPVLIFYRRGAVERARRDHGAPAYRWCEGWSENSPTGGALYPWLTKREAYAQARKAGATAVFMDPPHPTYIPRGNPGKPVRNNSC